MCSQKITNENQQIRVRIAPSPTGPLHIGTARTALFNYLFAKKFNGAFVLRIEDTDIERSKPEWEKEVIEGFLWLGIQWDEGPDKGGPHGPYRQSERQEIYKQYIEKLLQEQKAYWCFCTKEEIEAYKQERLSRGQSPIFHCLCSELSPKQIEEKRAKNPQAVIRFKMPYRSVAFEDLLRGKIVYDSSLFEDMVIAKNLQEPLYNLACVIDDYAMKITHVIRGEDHISNTPRQILLAEALGWQPPAFLHLPLILGPDRAKLSKRHKVTTSITQYKQQGYLPEALINFIALLGWNPGDNREIFSLKELIENFSVQKIQKSGAVFNQQKLDWFNGYFIRKKSLSEITKLCIPYLQQAGFVGSGGEEQTKKIEPMIALYHERLKKIAEIPELIDFFFLEKLDYPKELLLWDKMTEKDTMAILDKLYDLLLNINEPEWTEQSLRQLIMTQANQLTDRGMLLWPLRAALSGKKASAGPIEIASVLGKAKTLERIKQAMEKLS